MYYCGMISAAHGVSEPAGAMISFTFLDGSMVSRDESYLTKRSVLPSPRVEAL